MYTYVVAACALAMPGGVVALADEGRWPRICARPTFQRRAGKTDGVAMCFRVAMFSLHTSPLASLGRTRDAGGMNVYVRELARELGRSGIDVDIFTRRSDPNLAPFSNLPNVSV